VPSSQGDCLSSTNALQSVSSQSPPPPCLSTEITSQIPYSQQRSYVRSLCHPVHPLKVLFAHPLLMLPSILLSSCCLPFSSSHAAFHSPPLMLPSILLLSCCLPFPSCCLPCPHCAFPSPHGAFFPCPHTAFFSTPLTLPPLHAQLSCETISTSVFE